MHEVSLAREIVTLAANAVQDAGASKGLAVRIRVGELTCVAPDPLRFAFEVAARGTLVEGAQLVIEHAPLVLRCANCQRDVPPVAPFKLACSLCGQPCPQVAAGRELEVLTVECPDEDPNAGNGRLHGAQNAAADC